MSLALETGAAFCRASGIAAGAVAVSRALADGRNGNEGKHGINGVLLWGLLLAPFLTPALLVSYGYSRVAWGLASAPWARQVLYAVVLGLKLVPLAVVVRMLVPAPASAEAWHCYRAVAGGASLLERARFALRGAGAGPWVAAALVFLLAFSDFELASLWSIKTWTVLLFDAQTGGLALPQTFRLARMPLLVEACVLALLLRPLPRGAALALAERTPVGPGARVRVAVIAYLGVAAAVVTVLPLGVVLWQAAGGLRVVAENFVLGREVLASVLFAIGAACVAGLVAAAAGRLAGAWRWLLAGPGLLGALVVSLVLLALFQAPLLRAAYDSPLPLLLALVVVLLPPALLLEELLRRRARQPAVHLARQMGSRRLLWVLETRPRLAAAGLLLCAAYFDFTAASILAPVGMTPVLVRLHNLAHYGQTSVLSAMLLAAMAAPVALLVLTAGAARLYARPNGR